MNGIIITGCIKYVWCVALKRILDRNRLTEHKPCAIIGGKNITPFFLEDTMKDKIHTKVHTFDLTGGASPGAARQFCCLVLNYGLIRKHFKPEVYDIQTGKGEQREAIQRRVNKLRAAIINHRFTPTEMHACALSEHIEHIGNGEVTLNFNDIPLPVLDGYQRMEALELIRQDGASLQRLVDNLPFPINISLDSDRRKEDFLNLNDGFGVHKAHMLQLKIDTNTVDQRYAPYYRKAREIALALSNNENSPFYDVIQFDQTSIAPLNANVLMTERKTDQIMSFFGSAKLIEIFNKTSDWFVNLFMQIHDITKNSGVYNEGKLLELPTPNGGRYKSGASFLIGVVNQFVYYMYLKNKDTIDKHDEKLLLKCIDVFNEEVDGDASSKRKATLIRTFAQNLFREIVEDPNNLIGGHFGIPQTLVAFFGAGCFGVDPPSIPKAPTETIKRGRKKKAKVKLADVQPTNIIDTVVSARADSDTSDDWTNEI